MQIEEAIGGPLAGITGAQFKRFRGREQWGSLPSGLETEEKKYE
jgi:hypothetical protein